MRLSVIIPTRHRNDSLARCLERLAPGAQTLLPESYEVIVTDDGATTTAESLLKERVPWAKWTAGPRRGPAANRNHGASLAQGDWLVFTDDDCLPDADWLRAYAESAPEAAGAMEGPVLPEGDLDQPYADCPVNRSGGLFWSANIAVRQNLYAEVGGFDPSYPYPAHEDRDLQIRLLARTAIAFVPGAIIRHPVRLVTLRDEWRRAPRYFGATAWHYYKHRRHYGFASPVIFARSWTREALTRLERARALPKSSPRRRSDIRRALIAFVFDVPWVVGGYLRCCRK